MSKLNNIKTEDEFTKGDIESDFPFILDGLAEREADLATKKERGEISCDLDAPEGCEECSG